MPREEGYKNLRGYGKKPMYDKYFQIAITNELRTQAKKVATVNKTTLSEVIREFLENYVEENKDKLNQRAPKKKATKKEKE